MFFCFPLHLSFDRTQRNTPSSQFVTMKTSLTGWFFLNLFNRNFLFVLFSFDIVWSKQGNSNILTCPQLDMMTTLKIRNKFSN